MDTLHDRNSTFYTLVFFSETKKSESKSTFTIKINKKGERNNEKQDEKNGSDCIDDYHGNGNGNYNLRCWGGTGAEKLTVNVASGQTLKDQTINVYKLFDLSEKSATNPKEYDYTVNNTYKAKLASALKLTETATSQELYAKLVGLTANSNELNDFAKSFAGTAITGNALQPTKTSGKISTDTTTYEFTGLDSGYYLVYHTGTLKLQPSLVNVINTATSPVTITLKGEAPSITKTADKDTVETGKVIKYTITGKIPDTTGYTTYTYKIHDTLSAGLTFVKDVNGTALTDATVPVTITATSTTDTNKPTTGAVDSVNKQKMTVDLSTWVKDNQANVGTEFTLTYYAKATEKADLNNANNAELEYSNNPGDQTSTTTNPPVIVKTPTYELHVNKHETGDTTAMLPGAEFELYHENTAHNGADTVAIKVKDSGNGTYVVAEDQQDINAVTKMVTVKPTDGAATSNLHIKGLAAGTYYLKETKAPTGYNTLTAPVKVVINYDKTGNNFTVTVGENNNTTENNVVGVANSVGTLLPHTGGMNTLIFTIVAVLLIGGVAISFVRSRRRS